MDMQLDRTVLKNMVREILTEEPDLLKSLIDEVIRENYLGKPDTAETRESRLTKLIDEDFAKYDTVFKDLA